MGVLDGFGIRVLMVCLILHAANGFYLPGSYPHRYQIGDYLSVKVNSLTSIDTEMPFSYYSLPFCKPQEGVKDSRENLGEILMGDRIENSPYKFPMHKNQTEMFLCRSPALSTEDFNLLKKRIDEMYQVNLILDNLPAIRYTKKDDYLLHWTGYPVGVRVQDVYYMFNHLKFTVLVHKYEETNVARLLLSPSLMAATSDLAGNCPTSVPGFDQPTAAVADSSLSSAAAPKAVAAEKWPGWPGESVFRLIVPVLKVGSIIGRKGEYVKKMCEETRARIRILEGAIGTADRIVLISGKEEPDAKVSPAMNAVIKVFKRVNGLPEGDSDGAGLASTVAAVCSIRLLVASTQAIYIIGKQGNLIKSIQENSGAQVRVLSADEVPFYATADERIVEIQGDSLKVLKALEAVVGHLRKFLVDHTVIPLFEKTYSASVAQDRAADTWANKTQSLMQTAPQTGITNDYALSLKRESLFLDRESHLEPQIQHSGLSLYGHDPAIGGVLSSGLGRTAAAFVTQVTQTMQIPLSYAEDIIGVGGVNIGYIRRTSGATLTVQESRGLPDEITVEIKGTSSQVQTAQRLIQEFIAGHKEPVTGNFSKLDTGLRSYSQLSNTAYPSSSLAAQSLGGYGSSGVGGYGSYRL